MTLPVPDPIALAHSTALVELIRQEIQHSPQRLISFARFMELALYQPGLGYYSAGSHKLGREGDFITAPEISPLFAYCVARQTQQILDTRKGDFLELGAGSGIFAKDLLTQLNAYQCLPENYYILEVSAELRERQKKFLEEECPNLIDRIHWIDRLPDAFNGVIFANEVLDALPTHCFRKDRDLWERCVTWENNTFAWVSSKPSADLSHAIAIIEKEDPLPAHYESEINLMLPVFMTSLSNCLQSGAILLSDYGYGRKEYYHPDRIRGTLQCFFRHHHHDNPFLYPGLQDITAHIDFTTVAESATKAGLSFAGYTTQAAFLLGCGLLELTTDFESTPSRKYTQNQAIKTLTLPSQMGEIIKVIAFTKDLDIALLGFSFQDRRRDL